MCFIFSHPLVSRIRIFYAAGSLPRAAINDMQGSCYGAADLRLVTKYLGGVHHTKWCARRRLSRPVWMAGSESRRTYGRKSEDSSYSCCPKHAICHSLRRLKLVRQLMKETFGCVNFQATELDGQPHGNYASIKYRAPFVAIASVLSPPSLPLLDCFPDHRYIKQNDCSRSLRFQSSFSLAFVI